MLTIICGEDNIASRDFFINLKKDLIKKNYQIIELPANQVEEIFNWQGKTQALFKPKVAIFFENLIKKFLGQKKDKILERLNSLEEEIFDWEDQIGVFHLKQKNIKIKNIKIIEHKPPTTIFQLLDNLCPGNLNSIYKIFNKLATKDTENLLFYMIVKHIRNLILIKENKPLPIKQSWQLKKLQYQAKLWPKDKLLEFYKGLFKIDLLTKTSMTPFSIKESLDILFCYFL